MIQDCLSVTELNSFHFSMQTRQVDAIKRLHHALIPYASPFTLPIRGVAHFESVGNTPAVLLLQEGFFSVCRQSDALYMGSGFSPNILGLADAYSLFYKLQHRPRHYIVAETACCGYSLPVSVFADKVDELNLWHDVVRILTQRIMVMSAREHELIGGDAYTKMRALLIELWLYPADVRKQINVQHFIQQRTSLSHSQIMKILSGLKAGGYINILRGKLIALRNMPKSF